MKSRIEFMVDDRVPPKKDGANSMWAKATEIPRLTALRQAALAEMRGRSPLSKEISLTLELHCPAVMLDNIGDLDNFVTGVCDGLMAAQPGIKHAPEWDSPTLAAIHPNIAIAIIDDSAIMAIHAFKIPVENAALWYKVVLEAEN